MASEVHRFTTYAAALFRNDLQTRTVERTRTGPGKKPLSIVVERREEGARGNAQPGDTFTMPAMTRMMMTAPAWELLLKHQAGSLEAAVGAVRRRNLIVSMSILGILGASMCLLLLSTRRAQRLARQQTEFVATVSHELRTPLAVIRSAAENLADGIVGEEGQVRKYGELMRAEGRRLTDMVEEILEFSGIESGERRLTAVPVDVAPLLREAIERAAVLSEPAGVDVELAVQDDLPPVLGDGPALMRVLQNLLANALKYGRRWEVGRRGCPPACGRDVIITVSDRGIGIDACRARTDLRAVLSRAGSRRRAAPGRRARPEPRPAHRQGPWRTGHRPQRAR